MSEHKTMKACPLTPNKYEQVMSSEEYIAEEKLEGNRALLYLPEKVFVSSGGHNITPSLEHLLGFDYTYSTRTVLDGEIWCKGMTDAEIAGLLNHNRLDVNPLSKKLGFFVFDILKANNALLTRLTLLNRKTLLQTFSQLCSTHFTYIPYITGREEEKLKLFETITSNGGEGIVLKNINSSYIEGKRPANNWYKLKAVDTWDVVIITFTEGEGKYQGLIGAFTYGMFTEDRELVPLGNCSGITDEIREDMTTNQDKWVGKVVEIAGLRQLESGAIKNPRFKRVREDKKPKECTL